MSKPIFNIREEDLAEVLEISVFRLDEIVEFFNGDPDDEWDLVENEDYVFINRAQKIRIFSEQGAYAVAEYLESITSKSLWDRVVEFFTKRKEQLRKSIVRKAVLESSADIIYFGGTAFLPHQSMRRLLGTNGATLNRYLDSIKRSENPLEIDLDYVDLPDEGLAYSKVAVTRVSNAMADPNTGLRNHARRDWCKDVGFIGKEEMSALESYEAQRERRITSAKSKAKRRDKSTCQITLLKPSKYDAFNLAAHHLYDESTYPDLAYDVDNLITIREDIHKEFHVWMGGTIVSCTANDFLNFLLERYPNASKAIRVVHRMV